MWSRLQSVCECEMWQLWLHGTIHCAVAMAGGILCMVHDCVSRVSVAVTEEIRAMAGILPPVSICHLGSEIAHQVAKANED